MIKLLGNKPLVALVGAVAVPMAALFVLASLPDRQRARPLVIAVQVALVVGSVVLFGVFLAKVIEQIHARRVRGWLGSTEGQEWLAGLADEEREDFLSRLGMADDRAPAPAAETPVDTDGERR